MSLRIAALDLGSNTFNCLIADVEKGSLKKVIADEVRIVRLGEGLANTKTFNVAALNRAEECLKEYAAIIKKNQVDRVQAVATAAARDALNKDEFLEICRRLGIPTQIIEGEEEARITFIGGTSSLPNEYAHKKDQKLAVIDVGGRSTEIIFGRVSGPNERQIDFRVSLPLGSVGLTEMLGIKNPVSSDQRSRTRQEIKKTMVELIKFPKKSDTVVGGKQEDLLVFAVAGTPTEIAKARLGRFDQAEIDKTKLSLSELEDWEKRFSENSLEAIIKMGISEKRADVIFAGTCLLIEFCRFFSVSSLQVSTRGVRYGLAEEMAKRG